MVRTAVQACELLYKLVLQTRTAVQAYA